jgi:hypothetical protein
MPIGVSIAPPLLVLVGDNFMKICRYCNLPIEPAALAFTVAYWSSTPDVCHRGCKDSGIRQEALECQCIDADCNDCKHYQRGKLAPVVISHVTMTDGRVEEVRHRPNVIIGGRCKKFDKPTNAHPNKWSGLDCFEHRRA